MQQDTSTTYVDEKKVFEITNYSVSMMRKDRHFRRGMPYIKLGRKVLYDLADVHRFMQARKIQPGDPA
ncbi:MAG TPA: DNA-binding protein [Thermodesulfobacteriota bacterium]|nr:DNA-binding protein [Thermodesulfobacteriota bacterium]HNU71793.1 DNA-binding protein [Thermodesulfobacteriota bacterium]